MLGEAILLTFTFGCKKTPPPDAPELRNPALERYLPYLLNYSAPLIGVTDLHRIQNEVLIFDARSVEEYRTSHIEGASYLGFRNYDKDLLDGIPQDTQIVVYCSVGYRSEKIAHDLQEMGFTCVYNLYGSIFEWVSHDYSVIDMEGRPTDRVHTYSRWWSNWIEKEKATPVW